ncbi:MAG: hypothetical protein ACE5I2_13550, partial [Anaerolineae bacterium]
MKLGTEVEPGSAVELLYLIPRFSGQATTELVDIGSFEIEAPTSLTSAPTMGAVQGVLIGGDSNRPIAD